MSYISIYREQWIIIMDEEHKKNRSKVCIVCHRKGSRSLSNNDIESVKKFVIKDYNVEDLDFPSALCNGCYLLLNKKAKGFEVQLPIVASYDPERSKSLRSSSSVCNCRICQVAKLNFKEAKKLKAKRGQPSMKNNDLPKPMPQTLVIFGICYARLYSGCNHDCSGSRRKRVVNIKALVSSPTTSQILASRTINDESLVTLGPRKKRLSPTPVVKKQLFSADDMSMIQQGLNSSTRQTRILAQQGCRQAQEI